MYTCSIRNSEGRKFGGLEPCGCRVGSTIGAVDFLPTTASTFSALMWLITHAPFNSCHKSRFAERLVTCSDRSLLFGPPTAEKPVDLKDEASQVSDSKCPST